jgi:hypothetical protein
MRKKGQSIMEDSINNLKALVQRRKEARLPLNGRLVNDACTHASGQEAVISYEGLDTFFQDFNEKAAQYLDEQLGYSKLCQLLKDYRSALETVYGMHRGSELQIVGEILRDRGEALGLWDSKEEEQQ